MRKILARHGLSFATAAEERRFVRSFAAGDLRRLQTTMLVGALVYYGFVLWDWAIDPAHVWDSHLIRLPIVLLVMLPLTALLSLKAARPQTETILFLYSVVPTCFLSVIYSVIDDAHGYVGCLITATLFVSTLLPMRLPFFVGFCGATFAAAEIYRMHAAGLAAGARDVNTIPLLIAMGLAIYSVAMRETGARRQFTTDRRLREARNEAEAALTALRETQSHLVQAEKLASLGRLVAGVAHEINTPLGVALTASTTLQRDVGLIGQAVETGRIRRSELERSVARLNQGTRLVFDNLTRASDLVGSFKQVAVDQAIGERRTFALAAWLDEVLASLGPLLCRQGHRFSIECPHDLVLDSHPGPLAQVLTNLVSNALTHAFPEGRRGHVALRVSRLGTDTARIVVSDDGAGILPEDFGKVFDPFFTTRRGNGSVGLGLHIAHNLVVGALAGRIEIASEPGAGTTIVLDLPGATVGVEPDIAAHPEALRSVAA